MTQLQDAESLAAREGLSFAAAMRMLAGAAVTQDIVEDRSAGLGAGRRRALARRNSANVAGARRGKRFKWRPRSGVEGRVAALPAGRWSLFGRPGLTLHGETEVRKRKTLVRDFQEEERIPFFVLSLKAGGSGLNLTAAAHVVHFDRWWNPAVENQATDRAFRIGQKQNVLVHKFVCRGTVEEKIDMLIESKRGLSRELLDGSAEVNLTSFWRRRRSGHR